MLFREDHHRLKVIRASAVWKCPFERRAEQLVGRTHRQRYRRQAGRGSISFQAEWNRAFNASLSNYGQGRFLY